MIDIGMSAHFLVWLEKQRIPGKIRRWRLDRFGVDAVRESTVKHYSQRLKLFQRELVRWRKGK